MNSHVGIKNYTLRARVLEGSLPMPQVSDPTFKGLESHNYEIFCDYTLENLTHLFEIAKEAYQAGSLSKFEIIGWAGGAANDDGDRLLWSFRPDKYNFAQIPESLLENFHTASPVIMTDEDRAGYDRFWKPLKFGFSLAAYEYHVADKIFERDQTHSEKTSLNEVIHSADQRRAGFSEKEKFICLTANDDRTWTAAVSSGEGSDIPLTAEGNYPVDVYFERTDINGSGIMERETCPNREALLSLLNWIGKAGFVPMEFWSFDIDTVTDQRVLAIFQGGLSRRYEVLQRVAEECFMDDSMPEKPLGKREPEHER